MALLSLPSEMERRVRQLDPIASLPPARQDTAIQAGKLLTFSAGAPIFSAGSRDDYVHYLLDGDATVPGNPARDCLSAHGQPLVTPLDPAQGMRHETMVAGDHAVVFRVPHSVLERELGLVHSPPGQPAAQQRRAADINSLRQGLFARLPDETLEDILRCAERRAVETGSVVVEQGRPADSFYIIRRGTAAVTRSEAAGSPSVHLADIGPGDCIGEEGLISNRRRNATVTMTSDGELLMLRRAHFENLIRNRLLTSHSLVDGETAVELGAVWIDARDPAEFAQSSMNGAINVPLPTLRVRYPELETDKTYIVYSDDAGISAATAFLLSARGFSVSYVDDDVQLMPDPLAEAIQIRQVSAGTDPTPPMATPAQATTVEAAPATGPAPTTAAEQAAEAAAPVREQDYAHTLSGQSLASLVREIHSDASEVRSDDTPAPGEQTLSATGSFSLDEELFAIVVDGTDAADEPAASGDDAAHAAAAVATQTTAAPVATADTAAADTGVDADAVEHALAALHAAIDERVERAVGQARREERASIDAEVQRQTAAIRQRAEELLRQKLREARARDRERMQAFETKLRSHYTRLTGLANRITHQKAEIQRARREIEEKLRAVNTVHRELSELGLNMTRELDGLDELMPSGAELNDMSGTG